MYRFGLKKFELHLLIKYFRTSEYFSYPNWNALYTLQVYYISVIIRYENINMYIYTCTYIYAKIHSRQLTALEVLNELSCGCVLSLAR